MEIKNLSNRMITAYKSVSGNPVKNKDAAQGKKPGGVNFDKVEFNFERSLEAAKANLAAEVSANAKNERIEALQKAYEGDSLPATPDQIAETIIG
ncbi:MAG: flagellar biosynthesis anti-sigma factor FlgM [Oscillospiraceae bacterium]|nr:flagellar biosynthesis anti-sigma factor FlgM [Oscillospiraceae bacterium]